MDLLKRIITSILVNKSEENNIALYEKGEKIPEYISALTE